ncbi:hypothetical protein ACLEBP_10355 [Escherichia coli]
MAETYPRLQRGRMAWLLMQEISQGNREPHVLQAFRELEGDLGYGMLLSRYAPDMNHVTAAQYQAAMRGAIPQVAPVFWSFRIMVVVVPCCYCDADGALSLSSCVAKSTSMLGAENGALEFAAAVDCD